MNPWSQFMTALQQSALAFREAFVTSNANKLNEDFDAWRSRLVRYDMYFASYENTVYRDLHSWAYANKTVYGLYKAIRNIYNPTYRLVEFWKTMIWGGLLDEEAGETGAIPIVTENNKLKEAIAVLWKASNWKLNKDLVSLYAVSMGDAGIKIVDDVEKGEVYFEVIHPSRIAAVETDTRGHIKGYTLKDIRIGEDKRKCEYAEIVTRGEGDDVIFETFKDGKPYPWNGHTAKWTEFYGFVPFVLIKHSDIGKQFGWAETHAGRSKIQELDDLASKLHDYVRKAVDPVWLFNFKKPTATLKVKNESAEPTENQPQPTREETGAIYVNDKDAKAQPLVTDLVDVEHAAAEVQRVIGELERDYPELQMDIWTVGGYTTGKALRTARQRVERKVVQRRPAYDSALIEAHGMAVAIGGYAGYEGYDGFSLESYKAGELKHSIPATRPIFQTDVLEGVEVKQMFWNIVGLAKKNGVPVEQVLADLGWSKTKTTDFMAAMKKVKPEPAVNQGNALTSDPTKVDTGVAKSNGG